MSRHNEMPPVPPANRSHKGTGDDAKVSKDTSKKEGEVNTATPPILSRTRQMRVSSRDGVLNNFNWPDQSSPVTCSAICRHQ